MAVHNASCKGIAHGDDGRALETAKKVAQAMRDKAKGRSKKEKNRANKKAQHIIEHAIPHNSISMVFLSGQNNHLF